MPAYLSLKSLAVIQISFAKLKTRLFKCALFTSLQRNNGFLEDLAFWKHWRTKVSYNHLEACVWCWSCVKKRTTDCRPGYRLFNAGFEEMFRVNGDKNIKNFRWYSVEHWKISLWTVPGVLILLVSKRVRVALRLGGVLMSRSLPNWPYSSSDL